MYLLDIGFYIFDGAVNKETNKLGVGCVAYNKNGGILIGL